MAAAMYARVTNFSARSISILFSCIDFHDDAYTLGTWAYLCKWAIWALLGTLAGINIWSRPRHFSMEPVFVATLVHVLGGFLVFSCGASVYTIMVTPAMDYANLTALQDGEYEPTLDSRVHTTCEDADSDLAHVRRVVYHADT